jgi:hypothetical protein
MAIVPMDLHATYSKEAAIAEYDGEPRILCDGQFVVLPTAVLGFLTIGKSTDGSHLRGPTTVIWKPSRLDYSPSDQHPWFPHDAREGFDRSGHKVVRLRRHHIFVRSAGTTNYVYAGEAHLGSYQGPHGNGPGNREACFRLAKKLPRDVWLQCGGYSGWQVDVNHKEHVVSQDDRVGLDHLLDELAQSACSHLCITRYEEDSLTIYTNPSCAWLMYLRGPDDSGLYLDDPALSVKQEHFRCACGISLDFPARQTVSHSQAADIVRHFFSHGELPASMKWDSKSK